MLSRSLAGSSNTFSRSRPSRPGGVPTTASPTMISRRSGQWKATSPADFPGTPITVSGPIRTRGERVAGRIVMLDRALEDTLPYLLNLLGIAEDNELIGRMDGQIKKRRTLEAVKRILLRESLNQPLMVMFEDLHWI